MTIVVFALSPGDRTPIFSEFSDRELLPALAESERLRKSGFSHVCLSTELADSVGQAGVSDDRPADYDWSKQHRGGPPR